MNEYAVENWFDYEIGGKIPLSLIESLLIQEIDNFDKIIETTSIPLSEVTMEDLKEKISKIIEKFKEWVKGIKKFLDDKFGAIFRKINTIIGQIDGDLEVKRDLTIPTIDFKAAGKTIHGDITEVYRDIIRTIEYDIDTSSEEDELVTITKSDETITLEKAPTRLTTYYNKCANYNKDLLKVHKAILYAIDGLEMSIPMEKIRASRLKNSGYESLYRETLDRIKGAKKRISCLKKVDEAVISLENLSATEVTRLKEILANSRIVKSGKAKFV